MEWLRIPLAFGLVFVGAFGTSFLASAWERRRKRDEAVDALIALLPGHDCGLCGHDTCRGYARNLRTHDGDPGICGPGGVAVEARLRAALKDSRSHAKIAFIQCGGTKSLALDRYTWDGAADCVAASALYKGPKECVDACVGLGSCAKACPLGAIKVIEGLARVESRLCSGCGRCAKACPKGVIRLVPLDAPWQVACNSHAPAGQKEKACTVSCVACGDCERLSPSWEFSVRDNLALASSKPGKDSGHEGVLASIAGRCPTHAIVRTFGMAEAKKKS